MISNLKLFFFKFSSIKQWCPSSLKWNFTHVEERVSFLFFFSLLFFFFFFFGEKLNMNCIAQKIPVKTDTLINFILRKVFLRIIYIYIYIYI